MSRIFCRTSSAFASDGNTTAIRSAIGLPLVACGTDVRRPALIARAAVRSARRAAPARRRQVTWHAGFCVPTAAPAPAPTAVAICLPRAAADLVAEQAADRRAAEHAAGALQLPVGLRVGRAAGDGQRPQVRAGSVSSSFSVSAFRALDRTPPAMPIPARSATLLWRAAGVGGSVQLAVAVLVGGGEVRRAPAPATPPGSARRRRWCWRRRTAPGVRATLLSTTVT